MASPAQPSSVICFGAYELDAAHGTLRKTGISVKLHPQPLRVLLLLAESPGRIVTREQIRRYLWGDNTFVDFEGGINFCVKEIRAALGDDPEKPRYIETVPRRGYRFIAPVTSHLRVEPGAACTPSSGVTMLPPSSNEFRPAGLTTRRDAGLHVAARQAGVSNLRLSKRKLMLVPVCISALFLILSGVLWRTKLRPHSSVGLRELTQVQLTANSSENAVTSGAISPDGKYLAYADPKGIHIKLIQTGETQDVPQPESLAGMQVNWSISPNWVRDGTRFIATADVPGQPSTIWSVPLLGGSLRKIRDNAFAGSVSRDGSLIAFTTNLSRVGDDREIWTMSPDGENARRIYAVDENSGFAGHLEWSPDGSRLAYIWHHEEDDKTHFSLESRDLLGGVPSVVIPNWTFDLGWSPEGRLIYSLEEPGPIGESCNFWGVELDGRTGQPLETPNRLTHWAGFCMDSSTTTADGKRLAFRKWAWHGNIYVADLEANGTRITSLRRFTLNEGRNYPAAWTPDSKAVIFGSYRDGQWALFKQPLMTDKTEFIATVATSKNLSDYGLDDFWSSGARVSPDGTWILYLTADPENGSTSTVLTQTRLLRVPIAGGAPEAVLRSRTDHRPACATSPAALCAISEQTPDHKQLIFTAFDPVRGPTKELARFDTDPLSRYPNDYLWDLSPDGSFIAVIQRSGPAIHLLRLDGASSKTAAKVITVKGWKNFQSINWSADGRGLFVSSTTKEGASVLHVDLAGNAHVLWGQKGNIGPSVAPCSAPWALASPDGRHLAIYEWSISSNMWMVENF
jgi:DNA-binding winged helix-turn-helix (wHTH) protein/Tol biopolymer transport system component